MLPTASMVSDMLYYIKSGTGCYWGGSERGWAPKLEESKKYPTPNEAMQDLLDHRTGSGRPVTFYCDISILHTTN
jgi:hypothetical protein